MKETMRRYRVFDLHDDEPVGHKPLHAVKLYMAIDDCTGYIMNHIPEEDRARFDGCSWVPVDIHYNQNDMTIEATFVPAV